MRPELGANTGHPTEIGRRHSIRLRDGDGLRDLLGTLTGPAEITKADGSIHLFDPSQIVAWRAIEELTSRAGKGSPLSLRIAELEQLSTTTWPAREHLQRGGWLYRISEGGSYRSNSVLITGAPDFGEPELPLDQELEYLINYFHSHSALPTIHLPIPTYQELDSYLAKSGWTMAIDAQMMVADKPIITVGDLPSYSVRVEESPSEDFAKIRGNRNAHDAMSGYPARYICLFDQSGAGFAAGRIATLEDWAIVTALFISPSHRGQGWSKVLMKELLALTPASKIALQVDTANEVALALYHSLGFHRHHGYRFRVWEGGNS